MLPRNDPDRIQITFDDHRLVANAGLIQPATLAQHLGLPQLVQQRLDLGDAPGRANTGDKIVTLVASALAGGDCIDDADVLHTGGTARTLGGTVKAPSTPGDLPAELPVGARPPTGPLRQLPLSRLHHRPGRGNPGTGGRPSPPRRDRECHSRPQVRRGVEPSPLGPLRRQRRPWLAVQVIAHNLARWTARLGLGQPVVTTNTLRRRFFSMAGRLTSSARRLTLHLPQRWPWENQFSRALARLRALPLPA